MGVGSNTNGGSPGDISPSRQSADGANASVRGSSPGMKRTPSSGYGYSSTSTRRHGQSSPVQLAQHRPMVENETYGTASTGISVSGWLHGLRQDYAADLRTSSPGASAARPGHGNDDYSFLHWAAQTATRRQEIRYAYDAAELPRHARVETFLAHGTGNGAAFSTLLDDQQSRCDSYLIPHTSYLIQVNCTAWAACVSTTAG